MYVSNFLIADIEINTRKGAEKMLNYFTLKEAINQLTPNPRANNIKDLMLKGGYKFYTQGKPTTLEDYSKGYLAKDNFKGFKYSISLMKEALDSLKEGLIVYVMLLEYEEEGTFYRVQQKLNTEEIAFFLYDSSKENFIDFVKESTRKEIKDYLEAFLLEYEYIESVKTLGAYQRFYFNEFLEQLENATEENINAFLIMWESGLLSRGARYMWEQDNKANPVEIKDFKAFLEKQINEEENRIKGYNYIDNQTGEQKHFTGYEEKINDYDSRIAEYLSDLSSEELALYNSLTKKLEHYPGTTYYNSYFFKILSDEERELIKRTLRNDLKEDSPLIEKLLAVYLFSKENKSELEATRHTVAHLKAFKEEIEHRSGLTLLENIFLKIINTPKDANTLEALKEDNATYLKNPDYLTALRSLFPMVSPASSVQDNKLIEEYLGSGAEELIRQMREKEELIRAIETQIKTLAEQETTLSDDDRQFLAVLRERKEKAKNDLNSIYLKLRPLTKNIAFINNRGYINKNINDSYKSERVGFYELANPGATAIVLLNEEALINANETTQALFNEIAIKITETLKNPIFFSNEEILDFYRAQKRFSKAGERDSEEELHHARETVYNHLNYIKGMQIKELSSKLKNGEELISKLKKTKKDISFIGTVINESRGGIKIYIDAYFFEALRKHAGAIRLSPLYRKLPTKAQILYIAIEELTYINSKTNGAKFSLSYKTLIKWAPNYIDRDKYKEKNPKRLYEAINHDAEKIEALGIMKIEHELESLEDYFRGVMLYNLELYEQRKKDHREARRKAYLKQEKKQALNLLEHKKK